jgi:hypothetical protein
MTLRLGPRKFALTAHVISSIGWAGGVASFLALAIAGLTSSNVALIRGSYVAMDLIYWSVIIPLGLGSLATGLVSSLGTEWGLFRYYWVVAKLLLTVPATMLMLMHLQPVGRMADLAMEETLSSGDLMGPRMQLLAYAAAALAVLLATTALSTYKPRGRTQYGAGKRSLELPTTAIGDRRDLGFKFLFGILGAAIVALAVVHVTGLHGH